MENAYRPVAADDEAEPEPEPVPDENDGVLAKPVPKVWLSTRDKINLIKPLILPYMLPLCVVYIEEYVINSVSWTTRTQLTPRASHLPSSSPSHRAASGRGSSRHRETTTRSGV